jgi:hypothetical protein
VYEVEIKLHKISKIGFSNKQRVPGITHKTYNPTAPNSSLTKLVLSISYTDKVIFNPTMKFNLVNDTVH